MSSRQGRLGCSKCNWKGYVRSSYFNGESEETIVSVCSSCNDKRGYNLYVKNKYGNPNNVLSLDGLPHQADVIDFDIYKKEGELVYYSKEDCYQLAVKQKLRYGKIPRRQ